LSTSPSLQQTAGVDGLVRFRRDIHAHPELARQEFRTTRRVCEMLEQAGLEPVTLPSGTGAICDITGGPGPTVALRADLDALPIPDQKAVEYRSTYPGVAHACGHDVHTTILVGVAMELAAQRENLPGRVRLIFQPAEESTSSGSPDMIAAGALNDVSVIFALHCDPSGKVGRVGIRDGAITSAQDHMVIRMFRDETSDHVANPINGLGAVVVSLPDAVNSLVGPDEKMLIGFGSIHTDDDGGPIPASAESTGTIRIPNMSVWNRVPGLVETISNSLAAAYGLRCELTYHRVCPAVVNDPQANVLLHKVATEVCGPTNIYEPPQSHGGEDFGWYLRHVPGSLLRLGVTAPESNHYVDLHSGVFDIDERAIDVGVRMMTEAAISALTHY
jgi:amidohydrolase